MNTAICVFHHIYTYMLQFKEEEEGGGKEGGEEEEDDDDNDDDDLNILRMFLISCIA